MATTEAHANCNRREPLPSYPDSTFTECSAGDSQAHFGWGYYRINEAVFRKYIRAECTGGDCGGEAVIGGFAADGTLVCRADWTNSAEVFCPDSMDYVIFAARGNLE